MRCGKVRLCVPSGEGGRSVPVRGLFSQQSPLSFPNGLRVPRLQAKVFAAASHPIFDRSKSPNERGDAYQKSEGFR